MARIRWSGLLVAAIFAALTYAFWALLNQPASEPAWPSRIQGFAFSPYRMEQDAVRGDRLTAQQIDADLALLAGRTHAVRTYSTTDGLELVPALAARHGINVALGAWLDARLNRNQQEIANAIRLARQHKNVVRVIVGNEVILRGDVPVEQMAEYLDRAREQIGQPVSTAEPWHVWLKHPELAEHVDFLAVHLLPYWEGIEVETAVAHSIERMRELAARFPDKPIVVAEVGWPSNGRTREAAVATVANQALFLRRFLAHAEREGWVYYVMEAFDQPWKQQTEGAVGAYWGVYDVERTPKFSFQGPIVRLPEWPVLAAASVLVALGLLAVFYLGSATLRNRGRSFLALVVYAIATLSVWISWDYSQQYLTPLSIGVGVVLLLAALGVIAVLLTEAHEWAEACWVSDYRRLLAQPESAERSHWPKVSIHVPVHDEPPDMVCETLDALARLDYPDYEVLVVDNNTRDESTWRPVEAHCARLGARFRFIHVEGLHGYKAGALNLALRETARDAGIVAVIDSDYVVEAGWLRDLVPAFDEPRVAVVQAPQDYRDAGENAFKAMMYAEYRGFFRIGMITRNERNAIIQHGTMTMVRRDVLENGHAWAEWCITEDAELGLSIFESGWEARYTARSYGRGLMPDTFVDFKKQRFRWAYGAAQILRVHAEWLFGRRASALDAGQRYHFIAGWLPWLADGFNLVFNLAALGWSIAMIAAPTRIDAPLAMFALLPLSLFAFRVAKLLHLYRECVGATPRETLAAGAAGLALSHTIGVAMLRGLFTRGMPFLRTPKQAHRAPLRQALSAAREEALMLVALLAAAAAVAAGTTVTSPDRSAWVLVLTVQALPYLCALLVSLASALPLPARWVSPGRSPGRGDRLGLEVGVEPVGAELATPAGLLVAAERHGGVDRRVHVDRDLA
jgi:exo-beta-1,3-glucanase (GH17 family)/glycosyltransferase involved in cell wall biosynthesis